MSRIPFPDVVIRPGTHLDTHLSSQPFSRCTVPLVCPAQCPMSLPIRTLHAMADRIPATLWSYLHGAKEIKDARQQAVLRVCLKPDIILT